MILGLEHAFLMETMKDLVFLMINASIVYFVDTKIVQCHLVMMMLIVVVEINSRVQTIQMNISLMMKKLGS